ncbi:RagB/SusD family nutrient uptake outer membrane protein [Pontibacter sp. MBLB2868]|uniref:RagB/SusD family nutrient uptake outer membrane protein n=1 Tax=Pontibacter sp. MBLB2868 TaxID=3451555 RepID=UPI003F74EEF1
MKPDKQLSIPTDKLENLLHLLDNTSVMNQNYPSAGVLASDNFYMTAANWNALSNLTARNAYIWERDVYNDNDRNDWTMPYNAVFIANLALEGIGKIARTPENEALWNTVKGSALFFRAHAFYQLLQIFARPYDPATAAQDPGIVLRLNPDINERSVRSSVEESYARVLADLQEAASLLPDVPDYKTRPSRAAALALLARTQLQRGRYAEALTYANEALALYSHLLNYNNLNVSASYPFPRFNEEVLFHCTLNNISGLTYPNGKVNPTLYASYHPDDLRKKAFFRYVGPTDIGFKGSYYGTSLLFGGIATDELYLIRAECHARLGKVSQAMDNLNALLVTRWKAGTFTALEAADADQALALILEERRKELAFKGLRWPDLRRLNQEERFALTLTRSLDGQEYILPPRDPRYIFPIPQKVIESSGIPQN